MNSRCLETVVQITLPGQVATDLAAVQGEGTIDAVKVADQGGNDVESVVVATWVDVAGYACAAGVCNLHADRFLTADAGLATEVKRRIWR